LSVVAPFSVLDSTPFKDRPATFFHPRRPTPYDRHDGSRSVESRLFDWRLPLEVHQERLRSTAATNQWRSPAHEGHVIESDSFLISGIVHDRILGEGFELFSSTAGPIFTLHRRTFHRTVRAKDAAVARLRPIFDSLKN
jgi:hypothetical protein